MSGWWRNLLRGGVGGSRVPFSYRREYALALPGSPLDALRSEKILAALDLTNRLAGVRVREPVTASLEDLLSVHEEEYVAALASPEVDRAVWGFALSAVQRTEAVGAARAMTGGTLEAMRTAWRKGGWAVNLGGGLHHARADRGQGFCLVNDVAIGIRRLREEGFDEPVLVVDLDLHDGDGTRSIFAEDETVFTYSVHNRHWDDPQARASLSLELGSDVEDERLLDTLRETLPPVFENHVPRLVVYLAGTDPAASDALGDWKISPSGMLARDRFVMDLVNEHEASSVILLAGGYGPESWRPTYRFLATLLSGEQVSAAPATEEVLMQRYRTVARLLAPEELTREVADEAEAGWGLTEEDLLGSLGVGGQGETRLLGYYTRHGVELALERSGILKRIRDAGFAEPYLDLELTPGEHTLRIFGAPDRRELLVESRMRRRHDVVSGFEVLFVDWMLLQNPRATFPPERPPLPGQEHPGLGLLHDAVAMYVLICERLGLDGLAFVPSHYHLAAQSNRYLRFADPGAQGRFEALRDLLRPLPLRDASRAVEDGRVRDRRTGETVEWEPAPMLLAVSDELQAHFGDVYEREALAARRAADLVLVDASTD